MSSKSKQTGTRKELEYLRKKVDAFTNGALALRDLARMYGTHRPDCGVLSTEVKPCNCGWLQALSALNTDEFFARLFRQKKEQKRSGLKVRHFPPRPPIADVAECVGADLPMRAES